MSESIRPDGTQPIPADNIDTHSDPTGADVTGSGAPSHGGDAAPAAAPVWATNPAVAPTWMPDETPAAPPVAAAAPSDHPRPALPDLDPGPAAAVRRRVRPFSILLGIAAIALAVVVGLHHGGVVRIDWTNAGPPTILALGALLVLAGVLGLRPGRGSRLRT